MSDSDLTPEGRLLAATLVILVVMAGLAAADVASDLGEGATLGHVLVELGIVAVGLVGAGLRPACGP